MMSVQPSLTRSSGSNPPDTRMLKFSIRRCCQPGCQAGRPLGIGRPVGAHVDRRRRALEDVQLLGGRAEVGHALHRGRAGADDADALVAQAGEVAVGVAAGVVVVPAAGVERVPAERLDAGDRRQLGPVQRPVRHDDEAGAHGVAAVRRDDPARRRRRPSAARSPRSGSSASSVEVEVLADRPAVGEDLRRAARTSPSGRSRAPRAAAGRCTTRRRTSRRGSGSSTRCRRSRRPSR